MSRGSRAGSALPTHWCGRRCTRTSAPPAGWVCSHQRAGEALEDLYGGGRRQAPSQLAHHFLAAAPAGEVDKAIDYGSGGARAVRLLAYEEAN